VIILRPGTAAILEKPVKGATIVVPDENGKLVPGGRVDLPAGVLVQVPK
jgi:hypothetical protein